MQKLSADLIKQVASLREAGFSFQEITAALLITKNQATHAAKLGGVVREKIKPDELELMKAERLKGKTFEEIGLQFNRAKLTVSRALKGMESPLATDYEGLIADYALGLSYKDLAKKYHLTERSVNSAVTRKNLANRRVPVEESVQKKVIELREEGMDRSVIAEQTGRTLGSVKKILLKNQVVVPPEQRQHNAYSAKLQKNPDAMADMRKELTPDIVRLRNENIREAWLNPMLREAATQRIRAWWSEMPPSYRQEYLTLRAASVQRSPVAQAYWTRLAANVGDLNYYSRALLGITGDVSMSAYYDSLARKKQGRLVGPYKSSHKKTEWECQKGHTWSALPNSVQQGSWCPRCAHVGPSKGQLEVYEFVKSLMGSKQVLLGDRQVIKPLELDIYVPSRNLAIEYNGLIFHSDYFGDKPGRHYRKFQACRAANVDLFAFFEDEWENKKDLIKAMITWRLGKFNGKSHRASKLDLREVSRPDQKRFFAQNHLDGYAMASFGLGLYFGEDLVQCISLRKNFAGEQEVCRLATDSRHQVHGGAARLLGAVLKKMDPNTPLISYSNNRLSSGGVYTKTGFTLLQENRSSYWYTDGQTRTWRFKCKRINDPEILAQFPTEKKQALGGVFSQKLFGDDRPLYRIEDYGHRKWMLSSR